MYNTRQCRQIEFLTGIRSGSHTDNTRVVLRARTTDPKLRHFVIRGRFGESSKLSDNYDGLRENYS